MQSIDIQEEHDKQLLKLLEDNPSGITFQYAFKQIHTLEDSISLSSSIGRLTKRRQCFKQNGLYFKASEKLAGEYIAVSTPVAEPTTKVDETDTDEIRRLMSIVTGIQPESQTDGSAKEKVEQDEEEPVVEEKPRTSMIHQMLNPRTVIEPIGQPASISTAVKREKVNTKPSPVVVVSAAPAVAKEPKPMRGTYRRGAATGYLAFLLYKFDGEAGLTYDEIFAAITPLKVTKTAIHQAMFTLSKIKMVVKKENRYFWNKDYDYPFAVRADEDLVFMCKEIEMIRKNREITSAQKETKKDTIAPITEPVKSISVPVFNSEATSMSDSEYFSSFLDLKTFLGKEIAVVKAHLARLEEAHGKL